MRLRGWLTVAAGLCLALLVSRQAVRLDRLGREEAARDEARGLTEAVRSRLEISRAMLDLNDASMARTLVEVGRWPSTLRWAALYTNEDPARPLAESGTRAGPLPEEGDLRSLGRAAPESLPVMRAIPGDAFMALTRLRIGARDLTLAMVLAPQGWRQGAAGIWSVTVTCLAALAGAALLLVWHGSVDILSSRALGRSHGKQADRPGA